MRGRSRIKAKAKLAIDRSQELERENQQLLARNRQLSERLVQAEVHAERLGVASMKQGRERILSAKKRFIMVDHSCQIGDEKLMVVMGMDADNLPELGQALRREDMEVLEVKAARQWKTEDMLREYRSMGVRDVCQRTVSASRCQCEAGRSDWRVETSRRVRTSQSIGEVRF